MRILKKTLSLVLVVAMVLGLCVVGASAYNKVEDFTDDVSKIGDAYYEAVGVLTGIGVIDGMTETAFEPQGNYTREQAAKIIAYMQLGKDKADSLKCTVAPFEDVAATRWSAGYIAYCVEQGIIDGMTETTFEPTGKLTGFQWAKMLLCAVGFGVNGEFTGSSWSVNTAKVAHTVDLFAGDLAGADHVALTREQAALYAFNVLTNVKKVAYSPNVTSYVYGIQGYTTVNGIGSTLGQDVFGLTSDTGIIVKNEGIGANATYLSKDYTDATTSRVAVISAKTSADMIYHAARVWSVKGVSVFVYDLAKTTTYACGAIKTTGAAAVAKVSAKATTLGTGEDYELDLIDNTAYAKNSYGAVTFKYSVGELGVTTQSGVTYLYTTKFENNTATIKAANIWTDISKINKGSTVIYLAVGGQYYIYAPTATTGTIKGFNNTTKAITLTDGTVLEKSKLNTQADVVKGDVGQTYTFVLDTHGHYMMFTKAGIANLYFYTGEWKPTTEFNSYVGEHAISAQFINVTTGEVVDLPVPNTFVFTYQGNKITGLTEAGYYDVDVANAYGIYNPKPVADDPEQIYANTYALDTEVNFDASTVAKTVAGTKIYLDNPTKFIIAKGTGTKVEVKIYNSLAEMLKAITVGNNVEFDSVAMTTYVTSTKTAACNVVFGYLPGYTSAGTNLFLPVDRASTAWSYDADLGYYYDGFYLNGSPITVYVGGEMSNFSRGFYTFNIKDGIWTLIQQTTDQYVGLATLRNPAGAVYLEVESNDIPVASEPVIVDLRAGYKGTDDAISELSVLIDQFKDKSITLGYTLNSLKQVGVIYILDAGWDATLTFSLTSDLINAGWKIKDGSNYVNSVTFTDKAATDKGAASYTVTLYNEKLKDMSYGAGYTAKITKNGVAAPDVTTSALTNGTLTVTWTLDAIGQSARDFTYTIGGLNLGTVGATISGFSVTASNNTNVVLGNAVSLTITNTDASATFKGTDGQTVPGGYLWKGTATVTGHQTAILDGKLSSDSRVITTSFYPLVPNSVTYTVAGTEWVNPAV